MTNIERSGVKGTNAVMQERPQVFDLLQPREFQYLWFIDYIAEFEQEWIRSWFFSADVKDVWPQHKLMEGQGVGIFPYERTKILKMPWVMRETIDRYQKGSFF